MLLRIEFFGALRGLGAIFAALLTLYGRAWGLEPGKSISQYNCQNWTRESGLPAEKINSITQTVDGMVWLGGQNGLIRFDGLEFTSVPLPFEWTRTQEIRKLCSAAKGGLWFATNNGGFGYFDGLDFKPFGDSRWNAPRVYATTILETSDGSIWTGMQPGWGKWKPDQTAGSFIDGIEETETVISLCEDKFGRIWRGTGARGVSCYSDGKWTELPDQEFDASPFALCGDAAGRIWVGNRRGLRCYDSSGQRRAIPDLNGDVKAILVDRHGALWVGINGGGLARLNDDRWSFFKKEDGLVSDFVTSLLEDNEGSLWIGTRDGLSQITDLKFPIFSEKEGIPPGASHSVVNARDGGIWIMSYGLCHFDGNTARSYLAEFSSINPYFINGLESRDGHVYLIDGDKNIVDFFEGKIVAKIPTSSWPRVFAEDDQGVLVAVGPVLYRVKDHRLERFVFGDIEPELHWINNLSVGRDGAIWIASDNGVFRVKNRLVEHWSTAEGLPGNRANWAREDTDGSVWVGLSTGVARIKNGRVAKITQQTGLFDNRVYAIVPDDLGYLWMSSGRGLFRVAREQLDAAADGTRSSITCENYEGRESVKFSDRTEEEASGCKTPDGRIWFPNSHGVVMIDPAKFAINPRAPSIHIERVDVDGSNVMGRENPRLDPGGHRIAITFAALSYISPKRMKVRYQLTGADLDWVDAGQRRTAVYSNLKPGSYTFRVQAANADGVWNTRGADFTLIQTPRFRETGWFVVLCFCAGMVAISAGYRWKARTMRAHQIRLSKENDALESKVAARTAELAREHALHRALLDNSQDQIYFKDRESLYLKASRAMAEACGTRSADELVGKTDFDFFSEEYARSAFDDEQAIMRSGKPILGKVTRQIRRDGSVSWVLTSRMALRNGANEIVGTFGTSKDITAIKEAEAKLERVHQELLETSRRAGMAEVASSLLHNVGNALNSVNVSVTVVTNQLRRSKIPNLGKVSAMLDEHATSLGTFITEDPRGRQLPSYVRALSEQLVAEQIQALEELDSLGKNVEHIKEIVSTHQAFDRVAAVKETLSLADLVDDVVRGFEAGSGADGVKWIRNYTANPAITVDKHQLLHVLVNLLKNAHQACLGSANPEKRISVGISAKGERAIVSIADNGIGIERNYLTRIFSHDFTTPKHVRGFGLHEGALAAKQMGGSLVALSDGPSAGATLVLDLPLQAPASG